MLLHHSLKFVRTIALAGAVLASSALPSLAVDAGVMVNVNMARILRLNAPAATVVIGNPGIADATIQDPMTLILTGKSYGQTNLIILDSTGNAIADTLVEVVQQEADLMTVYEGNSRTTMICSPVCQPSIMLGDDPAYTSSTISSSRLVEGIAQ